MIENTNSFKKMDYIQRRITTMSSSKKAIYHHLELLQNVGVDRWNELNRGLPIHWRNIVVELDKISNCKHPKELQFKKQLESAVNCETTVTACALCGKHLTKPKTDCR